MKRPNLLFLYTDEQAFDTLACYGNDWITMPHLNALADQSVVFDRAYVTQPVCTPSRSSLITGQWPHTNGCIRNNVALGAGTACLPELLHPGAYVTGHYGKWHLGDEIFRQHGFDEWRNYEDDYIRFYSAGRDRQARSDYHHYLVAHGFEPDLADRNIFSRHCAARLPEAFGKPAYIADQSIDFIARHAGQPFALYVNFLEPHMPFYGPRDDQYDPAVIPLPPSLNDLSDTSMPAKYVAKSRKPTECWIEGYPDRSEEGWRALRARYYGLCSLVDTHAGRILRALKDAGAWDDTIIVFTSDHGDMMGAHGQIAKGVMYEESVRVPLLIKLPGQQRMTRVMGAVSHIDVLPTLLDVMGQGTPDTLQGKSRKAVMEGRVPRLVDDVFIEWNNAADDGGGPGLDGEANDERALVTGDGWKFVWSVEGRHILFDLNADPREATNLFGHNDHAARVADYMARIRAWQARTRDRIQPVA